MSGISGLHDNLVRRVNVGYMLLRSAERFPDREMLVDGERRWNYRAFNRWTNQLAYGLECLGFGPDDRLEVVQAGERGKAQPLGFRDTGRRTTTGA